MGFTYESTIVHNGEIIDGRWLSLSVEFYQLAFEEAASLCMDFAAWVKHITDEAFISNWHMDDRTTTPRNLTKNICKQIDRKHIPRFTCEGLAISPKVHDKSTYKRELSAVQRYASVVKFENVVSADYPDCWDALFPGGRCENKEIIHKVFEIFNAPNKRMASNWCGTDLQAGFRVLPYGKEPDRYFGSLDLFISAFCLQSQVDQWAEMLAQKAILLGMQYKKVNGRIMLQPHYMVKGNSPYMHYFGSHQYYDDSHEETNYAKNEWYPTYYLPGVEWLNILSPLVQTHLPEAWDQAQSAGTVQIQKLPGGCVLVKSKRQISAYDVEDALAIKKILQPALVSGGRSIRLRDLFPKEGNHIIWPWFPRCDWAIVPVLECEIDIIGTELVISSL